MQVGKIEFLPGPPVTHAEIMKLKWPPMIPLKPRKPFIRCLGCNDEFLTIKHWSDHECGGL